MPDLMGSVTRSDELGGCGLKEPEVAQWLLCAEKSMLLYGDSRK